MKKLSLLVGGVILSSAVMAQKPSADVPMTLEGQLGFNASTLQFNAPAIRFRYFVTDNIAARVTFGIANTSSTQTVYENADYSGATGEYKIMNNEWNAAIGGEYHFAGTDRLSPYVGLDIRFGGGSDKYDGSNATNPTGVPGAAGYVADYEETGDQPFSTFGVALAGGVDYYFAENFYIGLELGVMWLTRSDKDAEYTATGTDDATVPGSMKESAIVTSGTTPTGNFRLGWRF